MEDGWIASDARQCDAAVLGVDTALVPELGRAEPRVDAHEPVARPELLEALDSVPAPEGSGGGLGSARTVSPSALALDYEFAQSRPSSFFAPTAMQAPNIFAPGLTGSWSRGV